LVKTIKTIAAPKTFVNQELFAVGIDGQSVRGVCLKLDGVSPTFPRHADDGFCTFDASIVIGRHLRHDKGRLVDSYSATVDYDMRLIHGFHRVIRSSFPLKGCSLKGVLSTYYRFRRLRFSSFSQATVVAVTEISNPRIALPSPR